MTPRRALVMRTFAQAYLDALPVPERIAFLRDQMLAIKDDSFELDVLDGAIAISRHAVTMTPDPIPNPGVSP